MLIHGIYNYLQKFKDSPIHPANATWSVFIPLASEILVALNAKKGFEILKLKTELPSQYFRYSIFSLIVSFLLFVGIVYFSLVTLSGRSSDVILRIPFDYSLVISSVLSALILISYYFKWKIMEEMKNSIVADSALETDNVVAE